MTDSATKISESVAAYAAREGLVEVAEGDNGKVSFRRPGFEGTISLSEMDARLGAWLTAERGKLDFPQEEFAQFLALTKIPYGRYERAESRLLLGRYLVICEILGINPIHGIYAIAPHLFGSTAEIAEQRASLMAKIASMPDDMLTILHQMLTSIEALKSKSPDA